MTNWKFKAGDYVMFNSYQSDLKQYNGTKCNVVRRLTNDEADLCETGPMYKVDMKWHGEGMLDAFEDELTETCN